MRAGARWKKKKLDQRSLKAGSKFEGSIVFRCVPKPWFVQAIATAEVMVPKI